MKSTRQLNGNLEMFTFFHSYLCQWKWLLLTLFSDVPLEELHLTAIETRLCGKALVGVGCVTEDTLQMVKKMISFVFINSASKGRKCSCNWYLQTKRSCQRCKAFSGFCLTPPQSWIHMDKSKLTTHFSGRDLRDQFSAQSTILAPAHMLT